MNIKLPHKFTKRREGDFYYLVSDNRFALKRLNWRPERTLDDICIDCLNWLSYLKKNLDRDAKDVSLFEIGPIFSGKKPGQQEIVISAIKSGMISRLNWIEKERKVDVFDAKRDVMQTLIETGLDDKNFHIKSNAPNYYHPGKSGAIYQDSKSDKPIAFFGEIHPNICLLYTSPSPRDQRGSGMNR